MISNEVSTKEKFVIEALRLFSEKGYEAVSVAEIAGAVGCSAPALYKHYKSKKQLLEAVIEASNKGFEAQMEAMHFDFDSNGKDREAFIDMTEEDEIKRLQDMVSYTIHNWFSQAFRKLCTVEQFHMKELSEAYDLRYVDFPINQYEKIFELWIESGKMKPGNARAMAALYVGYPMLVIGICDRDPQKEEECMKKIEEHIREFNKQFRNS
ncbi:MAG: TetR/AcrR family transcriptional regulator [Lachnospiraceae bacterium]|nr:TetR/AcrR family transcriptional regulator [Lachnospiraceae bacterium]MDD6580952.1 TetR/AcrR family transcriptional regulator [Lachnospiraceae bacterium]MDO4509766.1 TetR/AcrR family transcriptional regulator [Lachnospiraceae bacterium]